MENAMTAKRAGREGKRPKTAKAAAASLLGTEELGRRLAAARASKGLNQGDVAAATALDLNLVSRLERGVQECPSAEAIAKLAEFYDLPRSDLLVLAGYPTLAKEQRLSVPKSEMLENVAQQLFTLGKQLMMESSKSR